MSGVFAGIAGVSAGIAYQQSVASRTAASNAENNSSGVEKVEGTSNQDVNLNTKGEATGSTTGTTDSSGRSVANVSDITKDMVTDQDLGVTWGNGSLYPSQYAVSHMDLSNIEYGKVYTLPELRDVSPDLADNITKSTNHNSGGFDAETVFKVNKVDSWAGGIKVSVGETVRGKIETQKNFVVSTLNTSGTVNATTTATMNGTASGTGTGNFSGTVTNKTGLAVLSLASTILASLASLFLGVMWGSLIVAGVQGIKAGYNAHKANVMRREEILQQLMQSKKE